MNFIKAQKQIVNGILSGAHMAKFNVDDKHIFVTPDGYMGYVFPVSTIAFNADKIRTVTPFPIAEIITAENELRLTADLRLDERQRRTYRRLKGKDKNVFINVKFLECFQNPYFYQATEKNSAVIVAEGAKDIKIPVGIILPIRATWDDGNYYGDLGRE